ncbi:hypothetical protein LPJ71_010547, partial [Coemansia sp. S17]
MNNSILNAKRRAKAKQQKPKPQSIVLAQQACGKSERPNSHVQASNPPQGAHRESALPVVSRGSSFTRVGSGVAAGDDSHSSSD